jgi:predicted small integral membrane protein
MNTTFADNALKGRAITWPALSALAYWSVILAEAATGLMLAIFVSLRVGEPDT